LDVPFLDEDYRLARDREIMDEVQGYLKASAEALMDYEINRQLRVDLRKPVEFPEEPEVLTWLERVETWGLPNPGTWLDQPAEWLADVEAARRGRDMHNRGNKPTTVPDLNDFDALFADAPPPQPLVQR
jgi:hypothetical protein